MKIISIIFFLFSFFGFSQSTVFEKEITQEEINAYFDEICLNTEFDGEISEPSRFKMSTSILNPQKTVFISMMSF